MIITLCGSARFEKQFVAWTVALGLAGHPTFGLCAYPSQRSGVKTWYTDAEKLALDRLHKAKIELSKAILVLNVCAYIGESTMSEIEHAKKLNRKIYVLESWGQNCGIFESHTSEFRERKARYGIPKDYGSPIDTFRFYTPMEPSLLGFGGETRNRLIDFLRGEDAI